MLTPAATLEGCCTNTSLLAVPALTTTWFVAVPVTVPCVVSVTLIV